MSLSLSSRLCHEIGAGSGNLTSALIGAGFEVTAIEKDPYLAKEILADRVTCKQIITSDIRRWTPPPTIDGQKPLCIGNIPYSITSDILLWLTKQRANYHANLLMVQREIADRLTAQPHTKKYGRLTVIMQLYFKITKLFNVSRYCFRPIPRVESTVIQLIPTDQPPFDDERSFAQFTQLLFHTRRKTLGKIFAINNLDQQLLNNPQQRPENLSPQEIVILFNKL